MYRPLKTLSWLSMGALCLAAFPAVAEDLNARGSLQSGDEQLESEEFFDAYSIEVTAGQIVEVTMTSAEVDAYIIVQPPEGDSYENDDIDLAGDNINASVRFIAEETGTYQVLATTSAAGESGKYQVVGTARDTEVVIEEEDELVEKDPVSWKGGEHYDLYEIEVGPGVHAVVIASDDFDAFVTVHSADRSVILQGDDPPVVFIDGGKEGGKFIVVVTSYDAGETGGYTMKVLSVGE